jgi:hypothetical protein
MGVRNGVLRLLLAIRFLLLALMVVAFLMKRFGRTEQRLTQRQAEDRSQRPAACFNSPASSS